MMIIRNARPEDAARILEIYDYYVNGPGLEEHRAMTEYNATQNYGSAAAAGVSSVPDSEPEKDAPKTNAAGLNYNPMID